MGIQSIMAKATKSVEFMYDKTAEIQRFVDYTKPNGADGQRWETVHENVPCRLSSIKLDNTSQEDANVISYDEKIFLSSDFDVLAGDVVIVNEEQFESAKKPKVYVSHQEVLLTFKGYA